MIDVYNYGGMTNEEAIEQIKILKAFTGYEKDNPIIIELHEALDMAIKALEQQPRGDCISRQSVIEHICENKDCYKEDCKGRTLKRCPDIQWVLDLPPVTPQRPKGGGEDD